MLITLRSQTEFSTTHNVKMLRIDNGGLALISLRLTLVLIAPWLLGLS